MDPQSDISDSSSSTVMQCKNYGIAGISRNVTANYIEISKYREGEIYQYGVDVTPDHGAFDIPPPPAHMCLVFDAAMNAHRQGKLDGITMVYDAHTIAYASKRVCSPDETIELKIVFTEDGFTENYVIKLHETAVVNTSIVSEHMHGRGDVGMGSLQLALTALDLAIGSVLCLEMAGLNLSLFTHEQSLVTSGGLELWRGFSLSVRPGIDSLYLNVNIDATAIYPPGSLLDALMGLLGIRDPNQLCGRLTSQTVREIGPYLHHPVLHNKHSGIQGKQKFMVQGVTDLPLDQETIEWEDPERPGQTETSTVADYFQRRFEIYLKYPFLPGLIGQRSAVFPIEFCDIADKQCYKGKLDDRQAADLAKFACQRPGDYMNRILDILKRHRLSDSPAVQSFGLALHERLTEVESRVLPAPTVSYGLGSREPSFRPRDGVWNMRDKQVSRAAPDLMYWAVLVLANKQQTPLTKVQDFVTCLAETCRSTGYTVRNPRPSIVFGNPSGDIANQMEDVCKSIQLPPNTPPQLLLVILPAINAHGHHTVKNCAYTRLGAHTQRMQAKHAQRPNTQYCANLCLKINAQLGGSNQALEDGAFKELLQSKPTMFMGCDVSHPVPGEQHRLSLASVVGSVDFMATRHAATLIQLPSREELVGKLQEAVVRHLKLFYMGTQIKPQRIVFYRDGVSETQFAQVRDREIIEIQRACGSIENGYRPDITFLAVLRRHNTRFFPKDREGDRVGNCVPGTVVDRSVTVPGIASFYLFSHTAFQRTSRPTYYSVLHDDSNFSPDAIQQITYHLCCTYAVSTRSVSPVPPVCYARRVANRAQYHVVDMDFGSDGQEAKIISINPILDSDQDPYGTIAKYYARSPSCLLDPHTAVGVRVAETLRADIEILGESTVHTICLSTAHPAKFSEAVL